MPLSTKNLAFSRLRVGIFVLFGLAILAFLIINSTGDFNPFEGKLHLRARFPSADGLREGAEVQLAGVHIGKVDEVRLLPPDSPETEKVEALLTVSRKLDGKPINERIRTDSIAQLIALSVLANDKYINITPGKTGSPVEDNQILESSAATSMNDLTQSGSDLLKELNQLSIPATEILNKANRGEGTLGKVINDESLYKNLDATVNETRATMVRLQTTIDEVNKGHGSAAKLLNDPSLYNNLNKTSAQLEAISNDLHQGRGSAGKFLSNDEFYNESRAALNDIRQSLAKLNEVADSFKVIANDLNAGKGTAGKFLKDEQLYDNARDTLAKFNSTATKLDAILGDAQAGKGTVGKLLTDESLYNNVNQTTANVNQITTEGTKLIYDFRQNPKKYLRIKFIIF
ncbi:MAG: MlaD family protein [Pyrinomonadaceae bacterium]